MVLEVGGLFGQRDVRETDTGTVTPDNVNTITSIGQSTQTATFSTTSGTWVDVTNPAALTLTGLNAYSTYTIFATASGTYFCNAATGYYTYLKLVINGTDAAACSGREVTANARFPFALSGRVTGNTGSTSYIIKLQAHSSSAGNEGPTIEFVGSDNQVATITAFAVRTA